MKTRVIAQGDRELVYTRDLDAPRALVFDAYTKPELLRRWYAGPPGCEMPVCEVDLRAGGKVRYVLRDESGWEMVMIGTFDEVVRPERIVQTILYEPAWYPGKEVGTVVFTERAGRTTVKTTVRYDSNEAREAVLKSPMESGLDGGYGRLDEVFAELKRR